MESKTCRNEILISMKALEARLGREVFRLDEIVNEVLAIGHHRESTIRTHVISRMCAQSPKNHGIVYADLDRVGRGLYRQRRED